MHVHIKHATCPCVLPLFCNFSKTHTIYLKKPIKCSIPKSRTKYISQIYLQLATDFSLRFAGLLLTHIRMGYIYNKKKRARVTSAYSTSLQALKYNLSLALFSINQMQSVHVFSPMEMSTFFFFFSLKQQYFTFILIYFGFIIFSLLKEITWG